MASIIERKRTRSAERQAKWRAERAAEGMTTVTLLVPTRTAPEFKRAAELAAADHDLTVGRMVSARTGRLRGLG
jgi:hypothetical protein